MKRRRDRRGRLLQAAALCLTAMVAAVAVVRAGRRTMSKATVEDPAVPAGGAIAAGGGGPTAFGGIATGSDREAAPAASSR